MIAYDTDHGTISHEEVPGAKYYRVTLEDREKNEKMRKAELAAQEPRNRAERRKKKALEKKLKGF